MSGIRRLIQANAWYTVIVLMACYALSFIDRQILSLLITPIKRDLAISDTRIGILQGLAFTIFYTGVGLPLGRMVDRLHRVKLIAAAVGIWSFFTAMCAAAMSYGLLFLARMGVGMGEAGLSPASFSVISDRFPKEKLGMALGVFYMGAFIGSSLALFMGGTVVDLVNQIAPVYVPIAGLIAPWRFTFIVAAVPGLLFVFLVRSIGEPERKNLLRDADGKIARLSLGEVFRQLSTRWQSLIGVSVAFAFQATCLYSFLSWAPQFFMRAHQWTAGEAGRALGLEVAPFGCLGMCFGGALSDAWLRKGMVDAPLHIALLSAIGSGVLLPISFLVGSPGLTLVLLGFGLLFLGMPMGCSAASIQLILPNQVRGQASALFLFILNLVGNTIGPLMPGLLNNYLFKNEQMLGQSLGLTIGVAACLELITILLIRPAYRMHYWAMYRRAEADGAAL
jgi:MFS family permease